MRAARIALAGLVMVVAAATPVMAGSDGALVVEVVADDAAVVAGGSAAFTIRIRNAGAEPLAAAWFQNELPVGIDWDASIEGRDDLDECGFASSGTPAGQTGFSLGCQLGTLPPGGAPVVVHVFGQTDANDCRLLTSSVRAVATGAPDAFASATIESRCLSGASPDPTPSAPGGGVAGGRGPITVLPDTAAPSPTNLAAATAVAALLVGTALALLATLAGQARRWR